MAPVHPEVGYVYDIDRQFQGEPLPAWQQALQLGAGLIGNFEFQLAMGRGWGVCLGGQIAGGIKRQHNIHLVTPDLQFHIQGGQAQGCAGRKPGGQGSDICRSGYRNPGGGQSLWNRLTVDVQPRCELKAQHQVADDALPQAAPATAHCRRDVDIGLAPGNPGRPLVDRDAAHGGVDEVFGAVSFFIGVVEKFCRHDALLIADKNPGVGDTVDESVVFRDLGIQDAVLPYDL